MVCDGFFVDGRVQLVKVGVKGISNDLDQIPA
mgnify:CR=1 FL=1